ncbi:MAG: hypothetical protein L0Y56_17035, partial [Nitrospira sp.]|nr:hypothetical protein [Nitrospira sp.]
FTDGTTVNDITYFSSAGDALVTDSFDQLSEPNALGTTPSVFISPIDTITFTFDTPILAFGISFNTDAILFDAYRITTDLGDVAPSAYDPFPGLVPPTGQFAGLISDTPFSVVTITQGPSNLNQAFTLDDMTYARSSAPLIPEPSTFILLGAGFSSLLSYRWWHKYQFSE